MRGRELLDELEAQESRLVFDRFDDDTAWELGVALREAARSAGLPIAAASASLRCPGLPQVDDHRLVVEALATLLGHSPSGPASP